MSASTRQLIPAGATGDTGSRLPANLPLHVVPHLVSSPVATQISAYLDYHRADFAASTLKHKQRELEKFAAWLGADAGVASVTPDVASCYVATVLLSNGRARKTNEDSVGHLHAFWNYTINRGLYIGGNPWARLATPFNSAAAAHAKYGRRRPWTMDELRCAFSRPSARRNVWFAGTLALYTGARLHEICRIRVADVDNAAQLISIADRVTSLPLRRVPIHPVLTDLVATQCRTSPDGYLVPNEKRAGPDLARGRNLSRRFTNWLRDDLKITDRDVVFQSLRYTWIAAAESAGLSDQAITVLLGRKPEPGMRTPVHDDRVAGLLACELARLSHGEIDDVVARAAGGWL